MSFDLSKLPRPDSIKTPSIRDEFLSLVQEYKKLNPDWDAYIDSDPIIKIFDAIAFKLVNTKQYSNDQVRSVLISDAEGNDLDNLGALLGEERLENEDDERYRYRIVTALSKVSSAGAAQAYESLALESDIRVTGAKAYDISDQPGKAFVAIQSNQSVNAVADNELIGVVRDYLTHEDRKPLGVQVIVNSIEPINYSVNAVVRLEDNVEKNIVLSTMREAIENLTQSKKKIGAEIALSEIYAALNIEGVAVVEQLSSPTKNIKTTQIQVPYCTDIVINEVGNE